MHLNSGNLFSGDLLIWKELFLKGLTFWTYGRWIYIRRYTSKSINLFLQVCRLPGQHESDILHRTLPGAWIPMAGLYQTSVRLLEQSAPPTFCLRFLGKTLKLSLPTVLSRDLPSDSFYGNLSYYCYRKLVSVSVDGRCKYLTPRRQHMFAWRGWISSSRFMFTNYRDSRIEIAFRCNCMSKQK